jgi:hypothetical protein
MHFSLWESTISPMKIGRKDDFIEEKDPLFGLFRGISPQKRAPEPLVSDSQAL